MKLRRSIFALSAIAALASAGCRAPLASFQNVLRGPDGSYRETRGWVFNPSLFELGHRDFVWREGTNFFLGYASTNSGDTAAIAAGGTAAGNVIGATGKALLK